MIKASHVAVLVPSARKAANFLRKFDFKIGEEEVWDRTLEIYVERELGNSLLLMEPIQPGSYQRALEKRGPGLLTLPSMFLILVLILNHSVDRVGCCIQRVSRPLLKFKQPI